MQSRVFPTQVTAEDVIITNEMKEKMIKRRKAGYSSGLISIEFEVAIHEVEEIINEQQYHSSDLPSAVPYQVKSVPASVAKPKRKPGQKGKKVSPEIRQHILRLDFQGLASREIGERTGVAHSTVSRIVRQDKARRTELATA